MFQFHKVPSVSVSQSAQVFQFHKAQRCFSFTKRPGVSISQSAQVFQFHKVQRCFSFKKRPGVSVSQIVQVFQFPKSSRCFSFPNRPGVSVSQSAKVRLYLAKRGHTLHRNLLPGKPLSKSFFFFCGERKRQASPSFKQGGDGME